MNSPLLQVSTSNYGGDEHGLVCGSRFAPGQLPIPVEHLAMAPAGRPRRRAGGIPLDEHRHGFWWMVSVIVTLTVLIAWVAMRRVRPHRRS